MDAADKFLNQCVKDGRITQAERNEVRLGRESSGCVRPTWVYWGTLLPGELLDAGLTVLDCEVYANTPGWAMRDIAERLNESTEAVRARLIRVRRVLPGLSPDPDGRFGLPCLLHMTQLDAPGVPEPDPGQAIKF